MPEQSRIGGFEFGVHKWTGQLDNRTKRQLSVLRIYDQDHDLMEGGDLHGIWEETETIIFNVNKSENIVAVRQDQTSAMNPVTFQFIIFDYYRFKVPKTSVLASKQRCIQSH